MWRLEKDPYLSSTFGTVSVLDRPPDFDRLRARMERATCGACRACGWRVQPAPVNLSAPTVGRRPRLRHRPPRPAHRPAQARARCASCSTSPRCSSIDPFDRTRPLWQFVVVEGLRGGKAALVQKMHHTITDGEGGVQMSLQFLDFERDAARPAAARPGADRRRPPPPPPPSAAETRPRPRRRRVPPAARRRPAGPRAARRPGGHPDGQRGAVGHDPRRRVSSSSDTDRARSPLWTRALAAAAVRGRAGAVPGRPRTPPSGSAARSTRRSSPPPPRPPSRYHARARRAGRAPARVDGGQHPHATARAPTPSRWPGCWSRPARCRSPSASG